MNEHDTVVLTQSLPHHGLQAGDVGVIVHAYGGRQTFETEFVTGGGETIALVTLTSAELRPLAECDVLHVRSIPA